LIPLPAAQHEDVEAEAGKAATDEALRLQAGSGDELLTLRIEERIRLELTKIGLLEAPSVEYDDARLRQDDPICAQMRVNQKFLRRHVRQREEGPYASRKRLKHAIEAGYTHEKLLDGLHKAASLFQSGILPKFKYAKSTKPSEIRKWIDTWDRAYSRYKTYLANPAQRRKSSSAQNKKRDRESSMTKSFPPPLASATAMANFHKHHIPHCT